MYITSLCAKNIAINGTEKQRRKALKELSTAGTNRTPRTIRLATPQKANISGEATRPTQKNPIIFDAEGTRALPGKAVSLIKKSLMG